MKHIAVLGLGIMGHGIADNFLKHGYEVTVWNRSPEKADDLVVRGAIVAVSVADAVAVADLVFEVTANDESSRELWLGADGIISHANAGQTLITCATLSVEGVDGLAVACAEKGLTFFDMPMTGGRQGALAQGGQPCTHPLGNLRRRAPRNAERAQAAVDRCCDVRQRVRQRPIKIKDDSPAHFCMLASPYSG